MDPADVDRRTMLAWSIRTGVGALVLPLARGLAWAETTASYPDLVAVKNGSPAQLLAAGISHLGGMERFVKKGQQVLVKPNIGWHKTPVEGANTNPDLVGKIVRLAYQAGAGKVVCFDHSVNVEKDCQQSSGIAKAVQDNGGEMHTAAKETDYREVEIPRAKILKRCKVHKLYLDADVVINVPILKSHGGGRMTACMKNLMGVVWDRRAWHREGLQEAIAEFPLVRKPDLNVVDAYVIMQKNGPRGISTDDLVLKGMQILSPDLVLADVAAAKTLDMEPDQVPYLRMAAGLGLGRFDLEKSVIKRVTIGE